MAWVRCCGGGAPIAVNTPIGDLTGTYGSNAIKTSSIKVPTIVSGQVLRIIGKNNDNNMFYNYYTNVEFSTDGVTWTQIYSDFPRTFPTGGASTTVDVPLSSIIGNRGYFRLSTGNPSYVTITSVVCGTFS